LRTLGLSYREVRAVIPAAKATLSNWCADIALTPEQQRRLDDIRLQQSLRREIGLARRISERARRTRIRDEARREARSLLDDPNWAVGVVAYWAEGRQDEGASLREL
jgi:hypothetical protein